MLSAPLLLAILIFRSAVSYLVFGSRDHEGMVLLMAAALVFVVGFNYLVCVFTSLRNMKVVSLIELGNSVFFGALGIGLLCSGRATGGAMVVAYGASCLLCVAGSAAWLARSWRGFPQEPARMPQGELWSRLLPLAAWILLNNMLWNLFDVVDRYMIVHLLPGTPAEALAEVGNYRSSRVLPLLLSSITMMISGALLPHLSHDWEAGRRRQVCDRLNMFLKTWSVLLTAGAAVVLFAAPTLFRAGFQGKFAGGLHVLPWTLTYCTWFGLSMLLQTYLWCSERAYVASIVAGLGVLVNVGLNLILLPRLGLEGAVLATAAANGAALLLMSLLCRRYGFSLHRGDRRVVPARQHPVGTVGCIACPGRCDHCCGRDRLLPIARGEAGNLCRGGAIPGEVPPATAWGRLPACRTGNSWQPAPRNGIITCRKITFLTSLDELRGRARWTTSGAKRLHVAARSGREMYRHDWSRYRSWR